jgi:hypothetical protein
VGKDTIIRIKRNGKIYDARIEDIWKSFINMNDEKVYKEGSMLSLDKMKLKYGEEEGKRRYDQ